MLLGPSGCGKTTLLRMIAGFETPTGGEIADRRRSRQRFAAARRKIAMVFQSYALYPHMTVFKNIAFPLKAQGVPKISDPGKSRVGCCAIWHQASATAQAARAFRR